VPEWPGLVITSPSGQWSLFTYGELYLNLFWLSGSVAGLPPAFLTRAGHGKKSMGVVRARVMGNRYKSLRCKNFGGGWLLLLRVAAGPPRLRSAKAPIRSGEHLPRRRAESTWDLAPLTCAGSGFLSPTARIHSKLLEVPLNAVVVRVSGWGKPPEKAAYPLSPKLAST